mmetsp:Transcript_64999/g.119664  ORF Transcript_64999/g.119664 Transcript_64999/m.119664 type:complete len:333 (+) Transcript_64999:83-1081(+)
MLAVTILEFLLKGEILEQFSWQIFIVPMLCCSVFALMQICRRWVWGRPRSLNTGAYNEEVAMNLCMQGLNVRRKWLESDLVWYSNGGILPGTPDGMFDYQDPDSLSTKRVCVQIVRVPLTTCMNHDEQWQVLKQTILTKIIKSQQWLHASRTLSHRFVIFCWLPYHVLPETEFLALSLISDVQTDKDSRFSLRLEVPETEGDVFPSSFNARKKDLARFRHVEIADLATFDPDAEAAKHGRCMALSRTLWRARQAFTVICVRVRATARRKLKSLQRKLNSMVLRTAPTLGQEAGANVLERKDYASGGSKNRTAVNNGVGSQAIPCSSTSLELV